MQTQTFTTSTAAIEALRNAGFETSVTVASPSQCKRWVNGERVAILDMVLLSKTAQRAMGGRWGWAIRELQS